jgi:hypothetical protein
VIGQGFEAIPFRHGRKRRQRLGPRASH